MDFYRAFLKAIEMNELIEPADRIVVGVSGGLDSVALLDVLHRISAEKALSVIMAHVNYGLRGNESSRDEKFVKKLAKKYTLPCHCIKISLKKSGDNIQSAARRFRYDFFLKVAKKTGAGKIAIAHHADDQAETVILHLIRGTGLSGLRGMPDRRRISSGVQLIRPFLSFSKEDIVSYVKKHGLEYVEDSTNKTGKYDRNIVRHDIFPVLARQNPQSVSHICRTAAVLSTDDDLLNDLTCKAFDEICSPGNRAVRFANEDFLGLHLAVQRRLLRCIYEHLTGGTEDLLSDHINRMIQIIHSSERTGYYSLPSRMKFGREGDAVSIYIHKTSDKTRQK